MRGELSYPTTLALHLIENRRAGNEYAGARIVICQEESDRTTTMSAATSATSLPKALTGIAGLDEITYGGLPQGRPTLVVGSSGSGKTVLAMQFLVNGATRFDEPGVYVAFEETPEELTANVRSLGMDLDKLTREVRLLIDHVHVDRGEIEQSGEYDLEGLFVRLGAAIDSVGAKRIVLDTLEVLFGGLPDDAILRAELRRLFRWLKSRRITAVITGERQGNLSRQGLEEFVSDCVISLDHQAHDEVSTRRLRVVKYRGSLHGTNCYPFLINGRGISVTPITSLTLQHHVSGEFISSGVAKLDDMLSGVGYYRGSSVLVSGTPGSGKTSLAAHFVHAACRRGERALYAAYEESPEQIVRNMRSIGIDLRPWIDAGLLTFHAVRPSSHGLEMHLAMLHSLLEESKPQVFVGDPISNLVSVGTASEAASMLRRLVDLLKSGGISALFTSLSHDFSSAEPVDTGISSLMDTWLVLRDLESNGERTRSLYIRKSRGMAHSNQVREFLLTSSGIELADVYVGPGGVLMGSARTTQEAAEQAAHDATQRELGRKRAALARRRRQMESRIAALQEQYAEEAEEVEAEIASSLQSERQDAASRRALARQRQGEGRPEEQQPPNPGTNA